MSEYLDRLRTKTRWDLIPGTDNDFRLLCSNSKCSLSGANIRQGRLAVTSMHGVERHSQILSKNDMAFTTIAFLDTMTQEELTIFCHIFNKLSSDYVLTLTKL